VFLSYIDPGTGFTVATGGGLLIAFLFSFLAPFLFFFKKIYHFLKKNWLFGVILILLIIAGIGFLIGTYMHKNQSPLNKKIVILGLDGLSPDIVERLMGEGKLPHLARLKEKGSYRRLSTSNPSQSPIVWSCFATGVNPGKHGLFDFIKRNPENYMLEIAQTNIKNGKAKPIRSIKSFWHYTSEKNIPTTILSCPVTFPPDAINGKMLSGMGVPDILGTQGTFTFYTSQALPEDKDIGGKVFHVTRKPLMRLELIGPKSTNGENLTVPFVVGLKENHVTIDAQNQHFELKEKQWSSWVNVEFNAGLLRKIKGICKFYLVEHSPEFKLYISPINFDPRSPLFPISSPAGYSKELSKEIGLYYTQGMPMDTWAVNEQRLFEEPFLEIVNDVLKEKKAMLMLELERLEKGVLFCYFEDPDIIQHMFWRYRDPQHPLYEKDAPQEYKNMIDSWYQKMDALVGEVADKLNEDDILIVLSDHGFNTFRRAAHVNSWLKKNGYLYLKDQNQKSGRELFEDVDWSKTKAFAIGFGGIYINQEGREKLGIVKTGKETEDLKKELSKALLEWRDSNNSPIINSVYLKEEIFWGSYAEQAPDLFLGLSIGYRASWQTAIGGCPEALVEDNLKKWSGDHLFDPKLIPGILFTNFEITSEKPSMYDLAPTILYLSGYSKEEIKELDFDGDAIAAQ